MIRWEHTSRMRLEPSARTDVTVVERFAYDLEVSLPHPGCHSEAGAGSIHPVT